MGTSPFPAPRVPPFGDPSSSPDPAPWVPVEAPEFPVDVPQVSFWRREPKTRYVLLFILTLASTTLAGVGHYVSYQVGFESGIRLEGSWWMWGLKGLLYSVPVLAILGAHEFGHYLACVRYRVNASLPYFIPFPVFMTGTLGAVIRIRQPFPSKRALFDIAIAGPLAGFAVAVPVLVIGTMLSKVVQMPATYTGGVIEFGEPLLFKMIAWLTFGSLPDGYTIVMHPIGFAAWFGLLATALNLFPIGQLDGGHISYAVLSTRSTAVTIGTAVCLIGLSFVSTSWVVWTALTLAMLMALGPRHPRVFDEHVPLDRKRMGLAALAAVIFVLCFTPAPVEFFDLFPKQAASSTAR